ncbi:MAG: Stp1/IreP family PP2C-type Ser/Thr phosphatase [Euzebyales bacterium]|nr:Stp1/IreP family PP2C-type Ser/Thr phosphatase [Euzebyales bacterium]
MTKEQGSHMPFTVHADTDVGRQREGNEDNMFSGKTVFAVADGMGGAAAGEIASAEALKPVAELDGTAFDEPSAATEALQRAIQAANHGVVSKAEANPTYSGMGTTLTVVMVREDKLHLAHVGDSRAYLLRRDEDIDQLTTDHTLVEQLVQEGRLSRDEIGMHPQRSVITRAIGAEPDVEVDTLPPLVLRPGDQVLLCSDGLTGPVDDDHIAAIMRDTPDGDEAVRKLLETANERGGPDNITVVLLRIGEEGGGNATGAAARETTAALDAVGAATKPSIAIRTRPDSDGHNWASDFGRYGDRQGAGRAAVPPASPPSGGGRRVLAALFGTLVLLAILGAGGWLMLSRAFFLADHQGQVAIFNGLPQQVGGVALYRMASPTGVPVAELDPVTRERIRAGLTVSSRAEADAIVERYRSDIQQQAAPRQQRPDRQDRQDRDGSS